MRHFKHPLRSSLDNLTFNQIKLERIKQDRKIDTAQKKLQVLKHNHDYMYNKLDFKIKTSLTTMNSKKTLDKSNNETGKLMNIEEDPNMFDNNHYDTTQEEKEKPQNISCK